MRRTKIVATIGPASRDPDVLARMVQAGLDVARLNFSHGDRDTHADNAERVRELGAKYHADYVLTFFDAASEGIGGSGATHELDLHLNGTVVPEPSCILLLTIGAGLLLRRVRRRKC